MEIISVVLPAPSFSQDATQKLGIAERTIRHKTQIGTATNSTPSEVIGIDDDPQPMYPISYLRTNIAICQGGTKSYIELYIAVGTPLADTKDKDIIPVPSLAINDYEPPAIENDRVADTATNSTPSEVTRHDDDPQPMYPTNLFLDGVKSAADGISDQRSINHRYLFLYICMQRY